MTRFTDVGRKRKREYNEAQFNGYFEGNQTEANAENSEEPPKKKKLKYDKAARMETKMQNSKLMGVRTGGWGRSEAIKASAAASESRRQRRIDERLAEKTCFACRQKGHAAKNCPSNNELGGKRPVTGVCYRCGATKHTLAKCRKPIDEANPLPFASCFVCKGTGHLASSCPQNEKGVYPNGGSCKLCGQTDHLARACPLRSAAPPAEGVLFNTDGTVDAPGADEDDFMVLKRKSNQLNKDEQSHKKKKSSSATVAAPKKVVTF